MPDGEEPVRLGDGLSAAARTVWAKHDHVTGGWLPLWRHMADSGAVAGLLWDEWVPWRVRSLIAAEVPGGLEDARRLVVWLATTHDIGKATPAFACQVETLADAMRNAGLEMPGHKELVDRKLAPHGLAGQSLLQEWLAERHGWSRPTTLPFSVIAGGHHGVPPTFSDIRELNVRPRLLRTPGCEATWRNVQNELLDACSVACGVQDRLGAWGQVKLSQPVQALLSGLVIVADWIASNPDLFPYFPEAAGISDRERVEAAWHGLALPAPWQAEDPQEGTAELFASRFDLPTGARVRPVQGQAVELARRMKRPGLMIIEAPMGEGKTEAALAVAEIFAARSGAGGCYVALPTMATGNAMFPRLLNWLRRLPDDGATGPRSVHLAHSKAALNEEYQDLVRAGRRTVTAVELDGADDEWHHRNDRSVHSAELVAHQWLRGRKKAMLASFGVGTVDQLLFMGLKSRHLALRHLALAGKVVIIDEAHAYDTYMNSYLDRVLSWLGAYQVPVIVLSATLPATRRRELVEAYAQAEGAGFTNVEAAEGYPLLTALEIGRPPVSRPVAPSGRRTEVQLERLDDDLDVLADRLEHELSDGGCVLVVRNTVDRVLQTAAHLRKRFGDDAITVAHARFLDLDRIAKDADLLERFGPPGKSTKRPNDRHIVVASQVAEQSLDIDFDLLVTDLCPIDLLLQRMGRVHRHLRGEGQSERPPRLRAARCLVTGAGWEAVPVEPISGSRRIYRSGPLLRSAAVLDPYFTETVETGHVVRLPEDISPLVQKAYGNGPIGPAEWQPAMEHAHRDQELHQATQQEKAKTFLLNRAAQGGRPLIGWVDAGIGDADDTRAGRAQVRDSRESLEVLVVQRLADGTVRTVPWLSKRRGGVELPTEAVPEPRLAQIVAACGLRLPFQFSIPEVLDRAIEELEAECVPAWQSKECHWLAGELILFLDEKCRTRLAGYDLHYTPADGLEVTCAE
ncbi:CRISPR-associated endonuclease/helicase Cas3 [Thermomonospora echinospora]|uniref:CRISPR-associated endonuclease/helicase Cas3 n=1 Tax=Thermomonospora echinospora TaxID=1992 RepID=A0A1H6EAD7_9ACTN|nr:CRISPR-associated helicase/endonuclease Cas3 [Thermomonospora echinospora]SEG93894.1 CRISPR-associated endonuclease/helicase Cas3 [Thermomonospora echinospora]